MGRIIEGRGNLNCSEEEESGVPAPMPLVYHKSHMDYPELEPRPLQWEASK
jgi:hypothetical protein